VHVLFRFGCYCECFLSSSCLFAALVANKSVNYILINYLCTDKCFPLLVQQHFNGADAFNRSWEEFKVGFNDTAGNFWVGTELLHQLTKNGRYKLKVDMRHRSTETAWEWAEYDTIVVSNEASGYLMHLGGYWGSWPDALLLHSGSRFTTYDRDNDENSNQNCAVTMGGGFWWNNGCHKRNSGLNTPLGSVGDFRWNHTSHIYRLSISRLWLTC